MAKPDKATLKSEGDALKSVIAQARNKTLNFALLQGKDTMYLETHVKKNTAMLRKEAKKKGGGPKAALGQMNIEGKKVVFSVEEDPPGPFPKQAKKFFMARGLPMHVAFKLHNGTMLQDAEGDSVDAPSDTPSAPTHNTDTPATPVDASTPDKPITPNKKADAKFTKLEAGMAKVLPNLGAGNKAALAHLLEKVRGEVASGDATRIDAALAELTAAMAAVKAKLGAANKNLKATRKSIADKKQLTARLSDFELPDFEQLAPPKVSGGQFSFCANHLGLGSPYRVSGPADGSAPLTFEPI